jgi:hypothetical protein
MNEGIIYIPNNINIPRHIINSTDLITRCEPTSSSLRKITINYLHKRNEMRDIEIEDDKIEELIEDIDTC